MPIDANVLKLLSDYGLAMLFALLTLCVFAPWVGRRIVALSEWLGLRIDRLVNAHTDFLKTTNDTNRESVSLQKEVKTLIAGNSSLAGEWHTHGMKKLDEIHGAVKEVDGKVDLLLRGGDE